MWLRQEATDGRGLPTELVGGDMGGELVVSTTYTVHREKGAIFGNCLHRVGKEMMGEKIRKQGKSVFRPENGHDSIGH